MPRSLASRLTALLVAAAGLYLVGNDRVGLWDRDEPRYAQTSRQMLLSDPPDWVVPRLYGTVRTAKPVFIYWCQAASMRLLGAAEFAARLPSAVAMLLTIVLLGAVLGRTVGYSHATWTAFMLATSGLAIGVAKLCLTDSVLLLWITAAQLALCAVYQGARSWWIVAGLWIAIGLAVLTKGPVIASTLLSTMLILLALDIGRDWRSGAAWSTAIGWWRHARPLTGIVLLAVVLGPWLVAIHLRYPGFLLQTFWHDILGRTMRAMEGHTGPPGFHLLFVWATYLPWSLLLPASIVLGWKNRRVPEVRFALAAVIGPWLVAEGMQTKLVHYLLPSFPAIAFLTADVLARSIRGEHRMSGPGFRVGLTAWATIIVTGTLLPWAAVLFYTGLPPMLLYSATAISLLGLAYAIVVFMQFRMGRISAAAFTMGAGMMVLISIFYGAYLPSARFLWLPQRIAQTLSQHGARPEHSAVMIDFQEDSLTYYQGGTIRAVRSDYLVVEPPRDWATWIVLTRPVWNSLPHSISSRLEVLDKHEGLVYSGESAPRTIEVLIARKRGGTGPSTSPGDGE